MVVSYGDQSVTSEAVGFSTIEALRLTTDFETEKYLIEGDELTLSASTNYEGSTYAWYGRESGGTYSQISDGESLTITATGDMDWYEIYCEATNEGDTVQSQTLYLRVDSVGYRVSGISVSPEWQSVEYDMTMPDNWVMAYLDASVMFEVEPDDGETVIYHWEYSSDGTNWSQAPNEFYPEEGQSCQYRINGGEGTLWFRVTVGGVTSDPVQVEVNTIDYPGGDECPECHMGGGEHAPGCSYGGDPGGY